MKRLNWNKKRISRDGQRTYIFERPTDQQKKVIIPESKDDDLPI